MSKISDLEEDLFKAQRKPLEGALERWPIWLWMRVILPTMPVLFVLFIYATEGIKNWPWRLFSSGDYLLFGALLLLALAIELGFHKKTLKITWADGETLAAGVIAILCFLFYGYYKPRFVEVDWKAEGAINSDVVWCTTISVMAFVSAVSWSFWAAYKSVREIKSELGKK